MRVWCHSCPVCIYSLVLRVEDTLYGGEGTGKVEFGQQHVTNLGTVLVGSSSCILFKDCILESLVELCGVVEPVEFPCIVTELFLGLVHTLCVNPDAILGDSGVGVDQCKDGDDQNRNNRNDQHREKETFLYWQCLTVLLSSQYQSFISFSDTRTI